MYLQLYQFINFHHKFLYFRFEYLYKIYKKMYLLNFFINLLTSTLNSYILNLCYKLYLQLSIPCSPLQFVEYIHISDNCFGSCIGQVLVLSTQPSTRNSEVRAVIWVQTCLMFGCHCDVILSFNYTQYVSCAGFVLHFNPK